MAEPASELVIARLRDALQHLQSACASSGFACDVTANLVLDSIEVSGVVEDGESTTAQKGAKAKVVHRLTVTESMCNLGMNLHGGCQAFLLDLCTSIAILALRSDGAWETSGVTSSLACNYLKAVPLGTEVLLVSDVLSKGSRLAIADFRVTDANGTLYSQGTHTKMDDTQARRSRKERRKEDSKL